MEGDEIIIEDFTKAHLINTVPASENPELILPKFKPPNPKGGVGCKVQRHYYNWTLITQDTMALEVIQNGYLPKFKEPPPLVQNPEPFEYNQTEIQKIAIDNEIQHFLNNGVIEKVNDLHSPGYYSCVFVRPRSNDSPDRWRLIFDISKLNKFLIAPRFKMESTNTVRHFLKLKAFAVKLDLSDAFLHVPLHKSFRKYMRFFHRGIAYQFKSICFGANFSPYIFSYLINTVMKYFHKLTIEICAYLDDMLAQNLTPSTLIKQIHFVVQVMTHLGWTVNLEKSILNPLQIMDYIGLHINFIHGLVFPPQERWDKIQILCHQFLQKSQANATEWSKLLGLLTSCQDITEMGRLWLRPLQYQLNQYWSDRENMETIIPISQDCRIAIQWWTIKDHVMNGVPWRDPEPDFTIYTDSSDLGWGGHSQQSESVREVAPGYDPPAHQSERTSGNMGNNETLSISNSKPCSSNSHGQYVRGLLSEQIRGYKVLFINESHGENPPMVQGKQDQIESPTYSWQTECGKRPIIPCRSDNLHRVVSPPSNFPPNRSDMGQTSSRPIRNQLQHKTAPVLFSSTRPSSLGSGQPDPIMVQHDRIRIPSTSSHAESTKQNNPRQSHSVLDSTSLEFQELVSHPTQPPSGPAQETTSHQKDAQTTPEQHVPPKPWYFKSTRVEAVRKHLCHQGFSKNTAYCISQRCKQATNNLYEARWKIFVRWCNKRKVNPFNINEPQLADFLYYLSHDLKKGLSAVQGYRAVINSTISLCKNREPGNNIQINSLLRSIKINQPIVDHQIPKWNLNLVLNSLTREPYEPMTSASLKHISWKTAFLVAFATAARIGELKAIDSKQVSHNASWSTVTLQTHPLFVAKNQDLALDNSPRSFTIPALYDFAGPDLPDRLLCPVRSLRYYLHKTKPLRTKHKRALFISFDPKHQGEITTNTLANWVKNVIKHAYDSSDEEQQDLGRVTAHEVRALSASVCFRKNLSIQAINKACYWRGHSTFTNYYLRDIAMHRNGELHLPNVIAASHKIT